VPKSCYLAAAHITTAIGGTGAGSITVAPTLVGEGCADVQRSFGAEVYNRSSGAVIVPRMLSASESGALVVDLPRPLHPWSPASPHLYGLRLTVGEDTVEAYAGVREIRVLRSRSDGLPRTHLNGEPFYQAGMLSPGL
jgi:hypothetical protein